MLWQLLKQRVEEKESVCVNLCRIWCTKFNKPLQTYLAISFYAFQTSSSFKHAWDRRPFMFIAVLSIWIVHATIGIVTENKCSKKKTYLYKYTHKQRSQCTQTHAIERTNLKRTWWIESRVIHTSVPFRRPLDSHYKANQSDRWEAHVKLDLNNNNKYTHNIEEENETESTFETQHIVYVFVWESKNGFEERGNLVLCVCMNTLMS